MANYFTDRVVQHPGRVTMTPVAGEQNTFDMARAEGNVTEPGTPFNAEHFNGIADQIIEDTIALITGRVFYGTCPTAASGTTDKIVTVDPDFNLVTGTTIAVKFDNDCIATLGYQRKLNVNGTGAIPVSVKGMTTMIYNPWSAGEVVLFTYDGTYWQMVSSPTVSKGGGNEIQIGHMLIQWGHLSANAPAGGYNDSSATFPREYSTAPAVFLTTYSVSSAAEFAQVEICLAGVTQTGVTVRAFNVGTISRSPAVRWLAIGIV